jgi:hypothetical protein
MDLTILMTEDTPTPLQGKEQSRKRFLWLLECYEQRHAWHELIPFYAASEAEAEHKAQQWLEQQQPRLFIRISLRFYPHGFQIHRWKLPGEIEEA